MCLMETPPYEIITSLPPGSLCMYLQGLHLGRLDAMPGAERMGQARALMEHTVQMGETDI